LANSDEQQAAGKLYDGSVEGAASGLEGVVSGARRKLQHTGTRLPSAEGAAGRGGEWITTDREGRARQGKKSMVEKGGRKQMHD